MARTTIEDQLTEEPETPVVEVQSTEEPKLPVENIQSEQQWEPTDIGVQPKPDSAEASTSNTTIQQLVELEETVNSLEQPGKLIKFLCFFLKMNSLKNEQY